MKKATVLAAVLLVSIFTSVLTAESVPMIGMDDFDFLETVWEESYQAGDYTAYQERLAAVSDSVIPDDLYQYMLAEALFYKYYASSFIEMPENDTLDASLAHTIEYCLSIENEYPVLRTVAELFRSIQQTAPFKNTTPAISFNEDAAGRPVDEAMLPDASAGRLLMLRTLAEVDAMSQRLKIASESRGGEVQMKLKSSAYMSVMEKPAMVFVIMNEPLYADLRAALEQSGPDAEEMSDGDAISFGSAADAFYKLESLIGTCEQIATVKGIRLESVLSEEAWTAMRLYHTDPFAVLCLNETALSKLNQELEFLADRCHLFIDRINRLPEKREGSL